MGIIEDRYRQECGRRSDINRLLPDLKEIASRCNHVTEFGVREGVSSWALLAGGPEVKGYDINVTDGAAELEKIPEYTFIQADVLDAEIDRTEFLFIDTLHTYSQCKKEIALHSHKASRYLGFHDTTTFGFKGEDGGRGIMYAIQQLIGNGWEVLLQREYNNGLLILKKI